VPSESPILLMVQNLSNRGSRRSGCFALAISRAVKWPSGVARVMLVLGWERLVVMTRKDAIRALADGKKVCHPKAALCSYLWMNFEDGQIQRPGGGVAYMGTYEDGWDLYVEPTKGPVQHEQFCWCTDCAQSKRRIP